MKKDRKQIVRDVLGALFVLAFGGFVLFFVSVFAFLGVVPYYVAQVLPVIGVPALLVLALALSNLCGAAVLKWMKRGLLVILIGCVAYTGYGAWRESIPTVDDRDLLLYQYEPFREDNKLVTLEEAPALQMEYVGLPRLDGATALYPVYAAFAQAVYPEQKYSQKYSIHGGGSVTCYGTTDAYDRLIRGETDIIFVAGPSQAQLDAAATAGKELHLTPIGREAFVFFVNSRNPVRSLTVEEIQKIYTGELTNWKEVGGRRQKIRPFQRPEGSGSQTALQRLMGDLPLMKPEEENIVGGMEGIIRRVAVYRNFGNAIGFSFRYYTTEMVTDDQIWLLAVEGVEPTRETIRDGSYPISSYFYAITASRIGQSAPEETNPRIAALLDWILSEQGQEIVDRTGYVSLSP